LGLKRRRVQGIRLWGGDGRDDGDWKWSGGSEGILVGEGSRLGDWEKKSLLGWVKICERPFRKRIN
jgi:hypothetical protein